MGFESMVKDFDTLDFKIHVCDAVTGDADQSMGFSEVKSTQDWDKFDKALAKKRVDPTVITQAKSCCILHVKMKWGNHLGLFPWQLAGIKN